MWNQAAFDRAQWRYDNATPPEHVPYRCQESGMMDEDCDQHENGECPGEDWEPDFEEPPNFDEWRHDKDAWMDDPRDDFDF